MAKKFIHYDIKNGVEYASVYNPQRIKGKKINNPEYLGRVVDKERGIYTNKKQGTFFYSFENGYKDYPTFINNETHREEKLILDFGDSFCFYQCLKLSGLNDLFTSIIPEHKDTLMSLLGYKVLSDNANCYALDWWEGSYTNILFPNAKLQSQRISDFLKYLGEEEIQRNFFKKYLYMLYKKESSNSILIDSTGLPNDIDFPLTAVNNHNGLTSKETRLLFVVDKETKMPLFFRYNAGNIVDVSTLKSTIMELFAYGVKVGLTIVDAGYYSEDNIKALYTEKIPFLTRLMPNRKLYKELASSCSNEILHSKYMLFYRNRLLYIKQVKIDLFGNTGYAYVAIDHERRNNETYKYVKSALEDKNLTHEQIDEALRTKGMFILISSETVGVNDVLPLYYTRQSIEQIFDVSKNNAELLPLRVHGEETFRGHLMLSFISAIAYLTINKLLIDSDFNAEGALFILRNLKCKVFEDVILVKEPNKKMNDIFKTLKLSCPLSIDLW